MDYDIGIVRRRRIISPDDCYFAVPAVVGGGPATTWNPADATGATVLSPDHLTATETVPPFVDGGVRSVGAISGSDKKYVEFVITSAGGGGVFQVGFADATWTLSTTMLNAANAVGFREDGLAGYNGANSNIGSYVTSNRIRAAIDRFNNRAWFANGAGGWLNDILANQNPATNTGGIDITGIGASVFAAWRTTNNLDSITAAFSSGSWSFAAPSGFFQVM